MPCNTGITRRSSSSSVTAGLGFDLVLDFIAGNPRSRTGGLAAQIHNVRTLVQHLQRMLHRTLRLEKLSSVGERIRGDVHHSHDESSLAQLQRPGP